MMLIRLEMEEAEDSESDTERDKDSVGEEGAEEDAGDKGKRLVYYLSGCQRHVCVHVYKSCMYSGVNQYSNSVL